MTPEEHAAIIVDCVLANFGIHKDNAGDVAADEFDEMRAYTIRSVASTVSRPHHSTPEAK